MTRVIIGIVLCAAGCFLIAGVLFLASFVALVISGIVIAQRFRSASGEGKGWSSPLVAFVSGYLAAVFGICPLAAVAASYAGMNFSWLSCLVEASCGLCAVSCTVYVANLPSRL